MAPAGAAPPSGKSRLQHGLNTLPFGRYRVVIASTRGAFETAFKSGEIEACHGCSEGRIAPQGGLLAGDTLLTI
jgi:hypothetical protein